MKNLAEHNLNLKRLYSSDKKSELSNSVDLDSIDIVLREVLTLSEMREAGSFFTGQKLASSIVSCLDAAITSKSVVLDPTCGAGNLLIEASRKLPVFNTLSGTLSVWGKVLWGFDLHEHFIEATKLRLILEAINRGATRDCTLNEALDSFSNIKVRDGLDVNDEDLKNVTHVVMNPPFTTMLSPKVDYWKGGRVNSAAVVIDFYLRMLPLGCSISAVLPDVLRSGSRYHYFREFVSSVFTGEIAIWGRFNKNTNVDVFLLLGTIYKKRGRPITWFNNKSDVESVGSYFDVCVGPLVPYRDAELGNEYPYIYPKICENWKVLKVFTETRKYSGTVFMPPFVVVKRTSSPKDRFRAAATIIDFGREVAVENHLIVLKPKDGMLSTCEELIKTLKGDETNSFLNERIRLRHLTVGVVKEIPMKRNFYDA